MKRDDDHLSPPSLTPTLSRARRLLTSGRLAIALVFSLGYILGLLSNFSSSSSSSPSSSHFKPQFIQQQPQLQIQSTITPPSAKSSLPELPPPPPDLLRFKTQCADPIPQSQIHQTLLHKLYDGVSPYNGFPSPDTAALLLPPAARLRGWGSTNPVFRDLIESVRPLTIIELGSFLGASALHMASITRNLSLPSIILCLDDFRGWPGFRQRFHRDVPRAHHGDSLLLHQFMSSIASAGESDRVLPLPFSTSSALAALCEWGVYGDLIEVDAGHDFHSAWTDINMAYAVLRPGGVLFGHDYHTVADDRGVRRAVTLFAKVKGLQVRAHGEHWVLAAKPDR